MRAEGDAHVDDRIRRPGRGDRADAGLLPRDVAAAAAPCSRSRRQKRLHQGLDAPPRSPYAGGALLVRRGAWGGCRSALPHGGLAPGPALQRLSRKRPFFAPRFALAALPRDASGDVRRERNAGRDALDPRRRARSACRILAVDDVGCSFLALLGPDLAQSPQEQARRRRTGRSRSPGRSVCKTNHESAFMRSSHMPASPRPHPVVSHSPWPGQHGCACSGRVRSRFRAIPSWPGARPRRGSRRGRSRRQNMVSPGEQDRLLGLVSKSSHAAQACGPACACLRTLCKPP